MRIIFTLLAFLCIGSFQVSAQFNACSQWTWVKGGPGASDPIYGTKGVGSTSNRPGARNGYTTWTDASGRLWLFGGSGHAFGSTIAGYLGDVWRYDPSINQWTWMQGSNQINPTPIYGTKGTPSATTSPGSRAFAASWQTPDGNVWLYGGYGWHNASSRIEYFNDIWRYNLSANQWTWMGGTTDVNQNPFYASLGTAAMQNSPGSRIASGTWVDASGKLWLFGGYFNGAYNDLWKYDPATGYWTAVQANASYGSLQPQPRYHAAEWKDGQGNLWLFGGYGSTINGNGSFSDIWKYSISTNQWTLIKGDASKASSAQYGVQGVDGSANTPGGRYAGASWSDGQNMWFFGGYKESNGEGPYNDLWKYNPTTNNWTWIKGDNAPYGTAVYGTKGVASPSNKPAARYDVSAWIDKSSNLWVFGGYNGTSYLNDLWKLTTSTAAQVTYYQDYDKDGYGNPAVKVTACAPPVGCVINNTDCNDRNANINPGKAEVPGNGIDDDCDGAKDEAALIVLNTNSKQSDSRIAEPSVQLEVVAQPNPSTQYFNLVIKSASSTPVALRIIDEVGRVVEIKSNVPSNGNQRIGHTYKPGVYYAEVMQGNKKVSVRLIKLSQF
jgi:hypothetical protein